MRLVTFKDRSGIRIGVLSPEGMSLVDLSIAAAQLPRDMLGLIEGGTPTMEILTRALANGRARIALDSVRLLAPIPRPARNIICVGKNYHEHAREFHHSGFDAGAIGSEIPEQPIFFSKLPSTVIGPGEPIPAHLDATQSVDYEHELAVVIGKRGRGIPKAQAFEYIFGYTIINDVTSRTLQQRHKQWFLGKSLDGFCPMGPAILTIDAVPDVGVLRLLTRINGEVRQDARVADLIFDIPTLIEILSAVITLEPGDLIATGTPAGVGIGFKPPKYLKKGDVVALTIDAIGELINPVG